MLAGSLRREGSLQCISHCCQILLNHPIGLINPRGKRRGWRHCAISSRYKAGSTNITGSSEGHDWETRFD